MFDINIKNVKKGKRLFYIFLIAGVLFFILISGILVSNIIKLNSLDSTVLSTSVEVKSYINDEGTTMYSPVYYYVVNGLSYSCSSNSSSSINPGTENKTVYYDSSNPTNCMTEYSKSSSYIIAIFLIIPIVCIGIGVINIKKANKRIKTILELNQKGKLVKNLPYRLENTGMTVNNVPLQRPVVDYTLGNGMTVTLYGDARHDRKHFDKDGMVDLLIDENNPDNYFIDFEINRSSGNLPEDYYQSNNQANENDEYDNNENNSQTEISISNCSSCGAKIESGDKFCNHCGKQL